MAATLLELQSCSGSIVVGKRREGTFYDRQASSLSTVAGPSSWLTSRAGHVSDDHSVTMHAGRSLASGAAGPGRNGQLRFLSLTPVVLKRVTHSQCHVSSCCATMTVRGPMGMCSSSVGVIKPVHRWAGRVSSNSLIHVVTGCQFDRSSCATAVDVRHCGVPDDHHRCRSLKSYRCCANSYGMLNLSLCSSTNDNHVKATINLVSARTRSPAYSPSWIAIAAVRHMDVGTASLRMSGVPSLIRSMAFLKVVASCRTWRRRRTRRRRATLLSRLEGLAMTCRHVSGLSLRLPNNIFCQRITGDESTRWRGCDWAHSSGGTWVSVPALMPVQHGGNRLSSKIMRRRERRWGTIVQSVLDNHSTVRVGEPDTSGGTPASRAKDGLLGDGGGRPSSSLSETKNLYLSSLSVEFSEAVDGLLDLLEDAGVRPGYAFEFVRNAHDCVESLISEARELLLSEDGQEEEEDSEDEEEKDDDDDDNDDVDDDDDDDDDDEEEEEEEEGNDVESWRRRRRRGEGRRGELRSIEGDQGGEEEVVQQVESTGRRSVGDSRDGRQFRRVRPEVFKGTIAHCAEKTGIPKLVAFLEDLGVKAADVPKILTGADSVDVLRARVELLRQGGLRLSDLPTALTRCPALLSRSLEQLEAVMMCLAEEVGIGKLRLVKVLRQRPEILSVGVEEIRTKIAQLKELGLSDSHVAMIVRRNPRVLLSDVLDVMAPVLWYMGELKMPKEKLGTLILKNPAFLESSQEIDKQIRPIMAYLKSEGAEDEDLGKIISAFPSVINYDLDTDFRPTAELFEQLGVQPNSMGKILARHPKLMTQRNNMLPKIKFFEKLGLTSGEVAEVAENAPQLLCLSVENNLMPTVEYLQSLGISDPSLRKILKTRPMVLAFSLQKLQRNVSFLLAEIGIPPNQLERVVTRYPGVLSLSVEKKMRPSQAYLLSVGFKKADIAAMVSKAPSILGFSTSTTLAPKYEYAVNEIGVKNEAIVAFPAYFSYNLEKRIKRRFELARSLGMEYRLSTLYGVRDSKFLGGLTGEEDKQVMEAKLARRRNRQRSATATAISSVGSTIKRGRGRPKKKTVAGSAES
ncbi:hypothetical protein CBR_g48540 [Chara braunii]|uniref:Uncharacterized protein n=1 Tax=Chara braunii TaxID=69332 RepID=A0A388M375_CHABU|nr:hypothetical protein CBR_g48540 [Chara braunii]|eukprot:GBG88929.1 hypothetical protein CBR_g48540 [Chara braunii]